MRWWVLIGLVLGCNKHADESAKAPPVHEVAVAPPQPPPVVPQCKPGERTCVGDDVIQCRADGTIGATLESCRGACRDGKCADTCAVQDVELIYVVDRDGNLSSFDPKKLPGDPFQRVATLDCNPTSTLNSMAVDRYGIAWLGYHDGAIARASIVDGHCSPGTARLTGAPALDVGMGFVSDGPKANTEKLFLTSGDDEDTKQLAAIDPAKLDLTWRSIGLIPVLGHQPELTGTSEGRVFAYVPSPGRGFVQELDRATAKPIGKKWTVAGDAAHVSSYAFAFWGGVFYVFSTADDVSSVRAIHMKTGKQELVMDHLSREIVGAGVSTCAPLLERAP